MMRAQTRLALLALVPVALALSGCGVRGSLEAPVKAKAGGTATSPEAADAGPKSSAGQKPHRDFVLDGLIR
ncbi:MAG: hypothetical protein AB7L18_05435 [Hyphomicrobiaceae bacterium]